MLPVLLGIAAISVLSLMYLSYMSDYDKKEAADQLAREYILRMETEGYLSLSEAYSFVSDLNSLGFEEISLSGTTMSDAGYGNQITLMVSAVLKTDEIRVTDLLDINKTSKERRLRICKRSIAKN